MAKTTFYVQVAPEFYRYDNSRLNKIRATALTQKRPTTTRGRNGTVTVKLTLDIPDEAFLPLQPEAVIKVPSDLVAITPLSIEATDPHGE
jgi:hypothetical protein